jgi:hypothetical protein
LVGVADNPKANIEATPWIAWILMRLLKSEELFIQNSSRACSPEIITGEENTGESDRVETVKGSVAPPTQTYLPELHEHIPLTLLILPQRGFFAHLMHV